MVASTGFSGFVTLQCGETTFARHVDDVASASGAEAEQPAPPPEAESTSTPVQQAADIFDHAEQIATNAISYVASNIASNIAELGILGGPADAEEEYLCGEYTLVRNAAVTAGIAFLGQPI